MQFWVHGQSAQYMAFIIFPMRVTRTYSPLRGLTYSSCGGLQPLTRAFFVPQAKKELLRILGIFWCSVVTSVIFSSNLYNFEGKKIQENPKLSQKIQKLNKLRKVKKIFKQSIFFYQNISKNTTN